MGVYTTVMFYDPERLETVDEAMKDTQWNWKDLMASDVASSWAYVTFLGRYLVMAVDSDLRRCEYVNEELYQDIFETLGRQGFRKVRQLLDNACVFEGRVRH